MLLFRHFLAHASPLEALGAAKAQPYNKEEPSEAGGDHQPLREPPKSVHRASGSGRSWNRTTFGRFSLPPSKWNIVLVE